jgi:hypothetical protein
MARAERNQTCRNPLNGAKPVPGPIITIGVIGFEGSLKFDCCTNMRLTAFCISNLLCRERILQNDSFLTLVNIN